MTGPTMSGWQSLNTLTRFSGLASLGPRVSGSRGALTLRAWWWATARCGCGTRPLAAPGPRPLGGHTGHVNLQRGRVVGTDRRRRARRIVLDGRVQQRQYPSAYRYTVAVPEFGEETGHTCGDRELVLVDDDRVADMRGCQPGPFAEQHLAAPYGGGGPRSGARPYSISVEIGGEAIVPRVQRDDEAEHHQRSCVTPVGHPIRDSAARLECGPGLR